MKGGDTKFYGYPREPECQRRWILPGMRHDWAPTEHGTITFSKNCPHITAVKVVVSTQLFPRLQLASKQSTRKSAHDRGPQVQAIRELRRVRLAARIIRSFKCYWNYFQCGYVSKSLTKQFLYTRVCSVRAPVASCTWQYSPPLTFWFTRIPVELCVSTLHKVF